MSIFGDIDTKLLLKTKRNNTYAFDKLYQKYYPIVISYLVRLNCSHDSLKDITQEVLVRVWEYRSIYRADSTAKTYILGIAKNVLLEKQKQLSREEKTRNQLLENNLYSVNTLSLSESEACYVELAKVLRQAIPQLTIKQRQAIRQFYYKGVSIQDAAAYANCSTEAFRSRLRRARKQLFSIMKPYLKK